MKNIDATETTYKNGYEAGKLKWIPVENEEKPKDRKTELISDLRKKWLAIQRVGCCKEWADDFWAFYHWAVDNGYEVGDMIRRTEYNTPHSPANTTVRECAKVRHFTDSAEFIARWNRTVNVFRKHEGLELFAVVETQVITEREKTCKDCAHYKVCRYKMDDIPICEDFLE